MRLVFLLFLVGLLAPLHASPTPEAIAKAFDGTDGAFVLIDGPTGEPLIHNKPTATTPHGPCSTFKIWNSLIALEEGLLKSPDAPFWKWDGVERDFPAWNSDQTWRSAFRSSCVPAFQDLARRIGPVRMQSWLDTIGYGNRDMAGRPDGFWLPRAGQRTILISPLEQARLVQRLVDGNLPVSTNSIDILKDGMLLEQTPQGTLYGKTGSGLRSAAEGPASANDFDMGWLVGFITHEGKNHAYACLVLGPGRSGKDAKHIVETIFKSADML